MQDLLTRCKLCTIVIYSGCVFGQSCIKYMLHSMHVIVINKTCFVLVLLPSPLDILSTYMYSQLSGWLPLCSWLQEEPSGDQLTLTRSNQQESLEHSKLFSYFFPRGFAEPERPGAARDEHAIKLSGKPALMKISGQKNPRAFDILWGLGFLLLSSKQSL